MLETLRIQNYALIDAIEVEFREGFNALTGETGAGKSIVVGALNLALGARASGEVVRAGADRATIEALFRVHKPSRRLRALLKEHDIALEDGALLLARSVSAEGRSRAHAGGRMVPVSVLAEIGEELVDLHGQHEHQSLLHRDRQLDLLDAFGGCERDADALAALVAELRAAEAELAELEKNDRERARQFEFMRFEVEEIDAAALEPGEDAAVKERLALIANAEKVVLLANQIYATLYENEEGSAIDLVSRAARDLDELGSFAPTFAELGTRLEQAFSLIEDVAADARSHADSLEFDPEELETLNRRRAQIGTLKRKYGETVEDILAYRDKAAAEIAAFNRRDERIAELRTQCDTVRVRANEAAAALSKRRRTAARKLDRDVAATLQELGMKGAVFSTHFDAVELGTRGVDRIEFQLAANAGEPLRPLRAVASGGEISRIMLSIKAVFAAADAIPALIFDEIDAGVGGAVANRVAEKLRELARSHQVICITHLAQIAAAASAHYHVAKETSKKRTATTLALVEGDARVDEVARLLDGSASELSREHARELLAGSAGGG